MFPVLTQQTLNIIALHFKSCYRTAKNTVVPSYENIPLIRHVLHHHIMNLCLTLFNFSIRYSVFICDFFGVVSQYGYFSICCSYFVLIFSWNRFFTFFLFLVSPCFLLLYISFDCRVTIEIWVWIVLKEFTFTRLLVKFPSLTV